MEKTGIAFGCFIPLHKGHESMIRRALLENDRIILAVCGYSGDRGEGFLSFPERIKLIREIYGSNPCITISIVDDRKAHLTGTFSEDAWRRWGEELFLDTGYSPADGNAYTWYTGEASYKGMLEKVYPDHSFVLLNRKEIPISGTLIRSNPEKYSDRVNKCFYNHIMSGINRIVKNTR